MDKPAEMTFLILGVMLVTVAHYVRASDPDMITDFGITPTSADNFTFTGFRNLPANGKGVRTQVFSNSRNTPGLTGVGLTAVEFLFGPESQTDPHTHPRASEIFYVLSGTVDVGLVDTRNQLFETTMLTGDMFVFPKGLLHYQRNNGDVPASGFSVLTSENPGTLVVSDACFMAGSRGLPDAVLASAYGIGTDVVQSIKQALGDS